FSRWFLAAICVRRKKAASGAASMACGAGGAASDAIQGNRKEFCGCWLRPAQQILRAAQ
ncbi:hypothetical protein A2U01_0087004, partial [Trifolium medium]|nr:hypothetical protein [Trifolium medium]